MFGDYPGRCITRLVGWENTPLGRYFGQNAYVGGSMMTYLGRKKIDGDPCIFSSGVNSEGARGHVLALKK